MCQEEFREEFLCCIERENMPVVTASSYFLRLSFYSWVPLGTFLCAAHTVLTGSHEENLERTRFDSQPHQRVSCEPRSISFHLHSSLHSKMNIVTLTYSTVKYKKKSINVHVSLKCYTDKHQTEACLNIHSKRQIIRSKCLTISHEVQIFLSKRLQHASVVWPELVKLNIHYQSHWFKTNKQTKSDQNNLKEFPKTPVWISWLSLWSLCSLWLLHQTADYLELISYLHRVVELANITSTRKAVFLVEP